MSTSNHPQTDGASEDMNRMIENYLRCYCSYRQDDWDALLPAAEFAYNSAVSHDLGSSPFEVDIGWNPSSPVGLFRMDTSIESVNDLKKRLSSALVDARFSRTTSQRRARVRIQHGSTVPRTTKWAEKYGFTRRYSVTLYHERSYRKN